MVGESCRESLRLNYTDGEHQIQEKLPRLWGERWGSAESGRDIGAVRVTAKPSPSAPLRSAVSDMPPSEE